MPDKYLNLWINELRLTLIRHPLEDTFLQMCLTVSDIPKHNACS